MVTVIPYHKEHDLHCTVLWSDSHFPFFFPFSLELNLALDLISDSDSHAPTRAAERIVGSKTWRTAWEIHSFPVHGFFFGRELRREWTSIRTSQESLATFGQAAFIISRVCSDRLGCCKLENCLPWT